MLAVCRLLRRLGRNTKVQGMKSTKTQTRNYTMTRVSSEENFMSRNKFWTRKCRNLSTLHVVFGFSGWNFERTFALFHTQTQARSWLGTHRDNRKSWSYCMSKPKIRNIAEMLLCPVSKKMSSFYHKLNLSGETSSWKLHNLVIVYWSTKGNVQTMNPTYHESVQFQYEQ